MMNEEAEDVFEHTKEINPLNIRGPILEMYRKETKLRQVEFIRQVDHLARIHQKMIADQNPSKNQLIKSLARTYAIMPILIRGSFNVDDCNRLPFDELDYYFALKGRNLRNFLISFDFLAQLSIDSWDEAHKDGVEKGKKLIHKRNAQKSHKEHKEMKRDVFRYMNENYKKESISLDEWADRISGKIVPLKWRTVRKYLTEWRKTYLLAEATLY